MNAADPLENMEVAKLEIGINDGISKAKIQEVSAIDHASDSEHEDYDGKPTAEEMATLRRTSGPIPWTAYTVAFVELCERFSYYGTTVVFVNFIQQPLPSNPLDPTDVSTTGAAPWPGEDSQAGALGMGQRASTGLTTFNAFWAYMMPLVGAYLADARWGRFKTIQLSILCALFGHIILIISAIPPVITHPQGAIACFSIGLIIMGMGVGGFKSNISPLLAEQQKETRMIVKTNPSGERVIMDPSVTTSRMFLWFYVCINIGSLVGSISMVYAEKYVGFWLAYLLPTCMFLFCPVVLWACKGKYRLTPPTGSVLSTFFKLVRLSIKTRKWNSLQGLDFWERCKPSRYSVADRPTWMTFDDAWVDQVARGVGACKVFFWFPLYWLAYGQMTNNLTSQAATMQLNGVPNDLLQNLNPLSIIIIIPIMDFLVYPALRKAHIKFTPLKRIFAGFMFAASAMVSACVIQYYIYRLGPCGDQMNSCDDPAPINVWVQTVPYVLIGISEIFASVTSLEYAFTKAPKNMRSLVMSINLFMNAFSSALAQAIVVLSEDPLLIWNYGVVAVLAFIGGICFWITHRAQDRAEDALNMLPESNYLGRRASVTSTIDTDPEKN